MKQNKTQVPFVTMGASSLLVIFLILSLLTFAVLSLSGAESDYTFSKRLALRKQAYYQASSRAERIISQLDEAFSDYAKIRENQTDYEQAIVNAFDGTQIEETAVDASFKDGGLLVSFLVPVSDGQSLNVALKVTDPAKADTYYEIRTWQILSDQNRTADQSMKPMASEE